MDIKIYLNEKRKLVEDALADIMLQAVAPFENHIEAMRYSLFAGGKRVRPILCLAAGEAVDKSTDTEKNLIPVACALECIHTYSLIHDDLPAMDDDDLRRGKPTNHTLFGEAGAILAGDGLLTWAFDLLSAPNRGTLTSGQRLMIIHIIARAAGPLGMVGGQALDIASENNTFPFETLQTIHKNKTGDLITCSVHAGAIGAGADQKQIEQLITFGNNIGLAFQIVDDLLNVTSTTEQLGKTAGSDANRGKATYPAFLGVEKTRMKAEEAVERAIDALSGFNQNANPLRAIAEYIYTRSS
ncbi:MAG: polyprenyl synthetase family protein [Desulforhopalus sp.]